jgi:hypothetical protein
LSGWGESHNLVIDNTCYCTNKQKMQEAEKESLQQQIAAIQGLLITTR